MMLIVGLGNPGTEYEGTRHNVGFMVLDRLARELGKEAVPWNQQDKFKARTALVGDVLLVQPLTFVNNSGFAVQSLMKFYKPDASQVWVIHDDMDLPLGKIRIRTGGGTAGHHGVESIMKSLKTDAFTRFRLGIGRLNESRELSDNKHVRHRRVIDFVLSRFTRSEAGELKHLVKRSAEAIRIALFEGLNKAMNRYH